MITPEMTTQPETTWSLPLFISHRNKVLIGLLLAVVTAFLYFTSNHIHIFEPRFLPMTSLDQAIPFVPYTVWVYISEYLLFFGVYFSSRDLENTNRYVYAFMFQQIVSAFIFGPGPRLILATSFRCPRIWMRSPTMFSVPLGNPIRLQIAAQVSMSAASIFRLSCFLKNNAENSRIFFSGHPPSPRPL